MMIHVVTTGDGTYMLYGRSANQLMIGLLPDILIEQNQNWLNILKIVQEEIFYEV